MNLSKSLPVLAIAAAFLIPSPASAQEAQEMEALFKVKCAVCHGTLAPSKEEMGALDLAAFNTGISEHQPTGGMVEKLSEAELEALHAWMQESAGAEQPEG
ncbi:c-type cytochrome [Afifella pfennigii]|uniref:c-type cytochrome n=1 Tax=Afifella pfennigii TaxID=209897 RepID=UPI000479DE30|nr:cytochrome c [Afifella pfennigii]